MTEVADQNCFNLFITLIYRFILIIKISKKIRVIKFFPAFI